MDSTESRQALVDALMKNYGVGYTYNPKPGPNMLESWPSGEPGSPDNPRPSALPMGQFGVEVNKPETSNLDILGDVTSHKLVKDDPNMTGYYRNFDRSISPDQEEMLHGQYAHAQEHEGEKRPYPDWREAAGLPAFFRGYPFKQWPDAFNQKHYSPEQRQLLDEMMQKLQGQ